MPFATASIIILATLASCFVSGIFGMAGGLVLMGALVAVVPVATALVLHGTIMMTANGWRAWLLRDAIDWRVFGRYMIGTVLSIVILFWIVWRPDKTAIYLILSVVPVIVWLPRSWLDLDIQKPLQAEFSGLVVQAMNTLAGVAGPVLDVFFVRTDMTPNEVVATKSVTQMVSHLVKIGFWGLPVIGAAAGEPDVWPPAWLLALALPLSMFATSAGKRVLDGMADANFRAWVKWLVTAIGAVFFLRAASGFGWI